MTEYGRIKMREHFEMRYGLDYLTDDFAQFYWGIWIDETIVWRNGMRRRYDYPDEVIGSHIPRQILELALHNTSGWLMATAHYYQRIYKKVRFRREHHL